MPFDLQAITRPNIRNLVPYSSARDEFKGKADIYLDANERKRMSRAKEAADVA